MQKHCGTCCFSTIVRAITFRLARQATTTNDKTVSGFRWVTHTPCLGLECSVRGRKRGRSLLRFAILGGTKRTTDHGVTRAICGTLNLSRKLTWSTILRTASSGPILTPTKQTFQAPVSTTTQKTGPRQSSWWLTTIPQPKVQSNFAAQHALSTPSNWHQLSSKKCSSLLTPGRTEAFQKNAGDQKMKVKTNQSTSSWLMTVLATCSNLVTVRYHPLIWKLAKPSISYLSGTLPTAWCLKTGV